MNDIITKMTHKNIVDSILNNPILPQAIDPLLPPLLPKSKITRITVKVYEEIKNPPAFISLNNPIMKPKYDLDNVEWIDNNGINTPYLVTYI